MNFVNVVSSNLARVGYNPSTHEMTVVFHNQRAYTYSGVPESVYTGLISAGSVGRYFHSFVQNNYPFRHGF